ncbi:hypothetical protein [Mesorhizobium sp. M0276]|uniref:hypothetical protein n=1 Tax=Mesorhizobium sp. M0276 TaxID=2956928 RepID=UPI003339DDF4
MVKRRPVLSASFGMLSIRMARCSSFAAGSILQAREARNLAYVIDELKPVSDADRIEENSPSSPTQNVCGMRTVPAHGEWIERALECYQAPSPYGRSHAWRGECGKRARRVRGEDEETVT